MRVGITSFSTFTLFICPAGVFWPRPSVEVNLSGWIYLTLTVLNDSLMVWNERHSLESVTEVHLFDFCTFLVILRIFTHLQEHLSQLCFSLSVNDQSEPCSSLPQGAEGRVRHVPLNYSVKQQPCCSHNTAGRELQLSSNTTHLKRWVMDWMEGWRLFVPLTHRRITSPVSIQCVCVCVDTDQKDQP